MQADFSLTAIEIWFEERGGTDARYLQAHFKRFKRTFEFASEGLPDASSVLDIGCHWLHQAYFFAGNGHRVTAADAPNTLRLSNVKAAAAELNISLLSYTRLDQAQGLVDLPSDHFDLIVFAEIIEHLAFNPLILWKEIYRVMKPGGRIIISTPNSVFYRSVIGRLQNLGRFGEYGISVDDILHNGTYGHHWKEFSVTELNRYFHMLSEDFEIGNVIVESFNQPAFAGRAEASELSRIASEAMPFFNFGALIDMLEARQLFPFESQILMDVRLTEKRQGILLSPPWVVD